MVVACGRDAYPVSAGPRVPRGLCVPSPALLPETLLKNLPVEAKLTPMSHSFTSAGSQIVFNFEAQTKLSTQEWCTAAIHVRFSGDGGGGNPRNLGQILATPGFPPATAPPTPPHLCQFSRPYTLVCPSCPREVALTDSPRVVSFCFPSLPSVARKTVKEQSRG